MLWVDTREPPTIQAAMIAAATIAGDVGESMYLESGDIMIADSDGCSMGIERKTWSDFMKSLTDGRMDRQAKNLVERYSPAAILLEGGYDITEDGNIRVGSRVTSWRHASLQMYLVRLQQMGLWVFVTNNKAATADVVRALCQRAKRGCIRHGARQRSLIRKVRKAAKAA